jgi:hypothetical protein
MPRGDGTGPEGRGPMTGRGAGRCGQGSSQKPRSNGAAWNFARGFGRNAGQRLRRRFRNRGLPGWLRFGRQDGAEEEAAK